MKTTIWSRGVMMLGLAFLLAGCEDSNDDFDVTPAPGKGALTVQNLSGSDFDVYVEGSSIGHVNSNHHLSVDLDPGYVRVFLREQDGDHRGYGEDLDILEGRQTIIRIQRDNHDWTDYDITVEYD